MRINFISYLKSHHYFIKIMFTLISFILILNVIISTAFYSNIKNVLLKTIQNADKDALSQISHSVALMINDVKSLSIQIYFNSSFNSFFKPEEDIQEIVSSLKSLDSYSYTLPYVQSIYAYSGINKKFYTNNSNKQIYNEDSFYDEEVLRLLGNAEIKSSFNPILRRIPDINGPPGTELYTYVYTFIFSDLSHGAQMPDKAIIVNISESWIRDVISALDSNREDSIQVIDSTGNIVSSNMKEEMLTDISQEEYIKEILNESKSSGYTIKKINKHDCFVYYVTASEIDWKFVRITPYEIIFGQLKTLRTMILMSFITVILIGIIAAYFISRRLYKPYDNMLARLNSIESEARNSKEIFKQEFLKKIIKGELTNHPENLLSRYGIKLNENKNIILALFKIDHYKSFYTEYSEDDRELFKFAIMNIATEIFNKDLDAECCSNAGDEILLLVNDKNGEFTLSWYEMRNKLVKISDSIKTYVENHFNISLSVFISSVGRTEQIHLMYNATVNLSKYRLFLGHKCTAFEEDYIFFEVSQYDYPDDDVRVLTESLINGNEAEAVGRYSNIISEFSKLEFNTFYNCMLKLGFALDATIEKLSKAGNINISGDFTRYIIEINAFEVISEINVKFIEKIKECVSLIDAAKINRYDKLIDRVDYIIKTRYFDPNLSINSIANEVNMSKDYVNRLYKKHTMKTIPDSIISVRMDIAKEMLVDGKHNIHEIAVKSGYTNVSYFCTLFKKYNGATPSQFKHKEIDTKNAEFL